jgi:hypothetical protein
MNVQELSWLQLVIESDVEEPFDVVADSDEETLQAFDKTLNLPGFGSKPQNDSIANQILITKLILSERDVRRPNIIVEHVKGIRASHRGT